MKFLNYLSSFLLQVQVNPLLFDGQDADLTRSLANSRFVYMLAQDNTDATRLTKMNYFKTWMNNACQFGGGWSDFIKPDGLTWHHRGPFPSGYGQEALACAVIVNWMLHGTPYQLSTSSQDNLKLAVMTSSKYTNTYDYPISLTGRFPTQTNFFRSTLSLFVYTYLTDAVNNQDAAQEFLRLWDPTTPEVISLLSSTNSSYVVLHTVGAMQEMVNLASSTTITAASAPSGSFGFPYAGLSVHRRDDWMVAIKGTSKHIWQAETYASDNLFGRYTSAGHTELYTHGTPVSRASSGLTLDGWD